jgi:uncharacterized membrane protein
LGQITDALEHQLLFELLGSVADKMLLDVAKAKAETKMRQLTVRNDSDATKPAKPVKSAKASSLQNPVQR